MIRSKMDEKKKKGWMIGKKNARKAKKSAKNASERKNIRERRRRIQRTRIFNV